MSLILYYHPDVALQAARYEPWCSLQQVDAPPDVSTPGLWLNQRGLGLLMPNFNDAFSIGDDAIAARGKGLALLTRACGGPGRNQTLLDPFGGYGLDAMTLALAGYEVTVVEREQVVWLLLQDAIERQGLSVQTEHGDGLAYLTDNPEQWDVIYLDPMFPTRQKRALPNRGLQHLQVLTSSFRVDIESCLTLAREKARRRVVLKRRAKDPVIGRPTHQIKGQAVRFDVYL